MKYTAITIIYNPISTGPSKRLAYGLRHTLRRGLPELRHHINITPTKYAGHAETLAYEIAKASEQPLIIASGGDGSYHEVVNGAMRAIKEGARPICGLLPGGNANDHYHALHERPVEDAVMHGRPRAIDVLRIEMRRNGDATVRYAHSYCGFGLTAEAGRELNKTGLKRAMEGLLVARSLRRLRPVHVLVRGQHRAYSSLVCSNIGRMSKVLRVSHDATPHDGAFELTTVRGPSKIKLLRALLLATTTGFPEVKRKQHYSFTTIKHMNLQLDGEIYALEPDTIVTITVAERALRCFV